LYIDDAVGLYGGQLVNSYVLQKDFFCSFDANSCTYVSFLVLKVLLPLVNVPMINYTLAWLESAGVEEVIVFCCAHSKQVIDYLESSEWFSHPNFSVMTIVSHNSTTAGDALRTIDGRNVVCPCLNFLSYISVFMRSWNFLCTNQF
jgi:hypothetical protein